jgi:uncharacterized protein YndB with AHSA1/START domain
VASPRRSRVVAHNEIVIRASPPRVFDVLSDGHRYADWVVGAKRIRAVEPDWPNRGAKLHHSVGAGPLVLEDHTAVEEAERPYRLVLHAKTRPFGSARIDFTLESEDGGTRVSMLEEPVGRLGRRLHNGVVDRLLRIRNDETLRRLKSLAES